MTESPQAVALADRPRDAGDKPPNPPTLSLWDRLSFSVTHAVVAALLMLVSLRGLYLFGCAFGTVEWLINHRRRRRYMRGLRQVLGAESSRRELRTITRRHFVQNRCDKLIYLIFDRLSREDALALLSISGKQLLDEAIAQGRGVYMATSHQGAFHVIGMLMAMKGYKVAGVRDRKESAIRRFVQTRFEQRPPEFPPVRVLFADAYPRDVYRCLKDGYLLGSSMDVARTRHPNQRTETVTIFGEERAFLSGPLRVAFRCRVPVLQVFHIPEPGFRHRLEIVERLVDPDSANDEDATVKEAMRRYAANVERYLREYPSLLTRA
jgi:KDO2-lipid IV(A) lauroyltransferase